MEFQRDGISLVWYIVSRIVFGKERYLQLSVIIPAIVAGSYRFFLTKLFVFNSNVLPIVFFAF